MTFVENGVRVNLTQHTSVLYTTMSLQVEDNPLDSEPGNQVVNGATRLRLIGVDEHLQLT